FFGRSIIWKKKPINLSQLFQSTHFYLFIEILLNIGFIIRFKKAMVLLIISENFLLNVRNYS
ncbi:hypothetical protein, partial [Seonamhaeicola marinus]|uniref:hypothetical protein n=1 Tax=Seonamhaeicola marinus TaxID=1912246 RepID=UPI001CA3203D